MPKIHSKVSIYIFLLFLVILQIKINANTFPVKKDPFPLEIDLKNKKNYYQTGARHTLILELGSRSPIKENLNLYTHFPVGWQILAKSKVNDLSKNSSKIILISIYIPANSPPGDIKAGISLKDKNSVVRITKSFVLKVAENPALDLSIVYKDDEINAGEEIETLFNITNKGNMVHELTYESNGKIEASVNSKLLPDSTLTLKVKKKTDLKIYRPQKTLIELKVTSITYDTIYRLKSIHTIYPTRTKKVDGYHRFPIQTGLNYNSYTRDRYHYSVLSADIKGNGFLDVEKNHYLSFDVRYPPQNNLKRFGVTDQYSAVYSYRDSTYLYLGDHTHNIDRLGFDSRFGMGFRFEHYNGKWGYLAYYSKPRLFNFNSSALVGGKLIYWPQKNWNLGFSLARSKGTGSGAFGNIAPNPDETGQIGTLSFNYDEKRTSIESEASVSVTNHSSDAAFMFNLSQGFQNWQYNGGVTISGEEYFGMLTNSLQFWNNLSLNLKNFDLRLGQSVSRVNQRLDPLFFAAEPYSENYFVSLGFNLTGEQSILLRLDNRTREDRMEPRSYFYKEYGLNYSYRYFNKKINLNFTGRLAKTGNFLSMNSAYRNTYAHRLDANYRVRGGLSLRGGIFHNYSNRYGSSDQRTNFFRYSIGGNIALIPKVRFNLNYNSGFSPEENYKRREFLNAGITWDPLRNHHFEMNANYFQNPGETERRELLTFAKYIFTLDVPLKQIKEFRQISGYISSAKADISLKGIRLSAGGNKVQTDRNGRFELNNLPKSKIFLVVDESTLPPGYVMAGNKRIELNFSEGSKKDLDLKLVRSGKLKGNISLLRNKVKTGFHGYVRLKNEMNSYLIKTNASGKFEIREIIPGVYNFDLLGFEEREDFENISSQVVKIAEGITENLYLEIKQRGRRIKFSNKKFKITDK